MGQHVAFLHTALIDCKPIVNTWTLGPYPSSDQPTQYLRQKCSASDWARLVFFVFNHFPVVWTLIRLSNESAILNYSNTVNFEWSQITLNSHLNRHGNKLLRVSKKLWKNSENAAILFVFSTGCYRFRQWYRFSHHA